MLTSLKFSPELIKQNMDKGEFGFEKEGLRIDGEGHLSHTKHPFGEQPGITRDFCENQVELITDVFDSAEKALQHLGQLQTQVVEKLCTLEKGKELLWPFSNPPYVKGEADIPVAQFGGAQRDKTEYRNYLAEKYGKKKMLFSGIHFNYSFAEKMLKEGYEKWACEVGQELPKQEQFEQKRSVSEPKQRQETFEVQNYLSQPVPSYQEYKDHLYLELAKKVTKYSWFIVYLTAASPVTDASFLYCGDKPQYASVRCGKQGYWNDFIPVFDYTSLETYTRSIEQYIENGQLHGVSELYYPVRLKPKGSNTLEHLKDRGINHIELRMLDVNPLSPIGLMKEDVEFLHYFMLYLAAQEEIELTEEAQRDAIINEQCGAEFEDSQVYIREEQGKCRQVRQAALSILQDMEHFYEGLEKMEVQSVIQYQKDKLLLFDNRYADRIWRAYGTDYVKRGLDLAGVYAEEMLTNQHLGKGEVYV